jgi:hypothetical protein
VKQYAVLVDYDFKRLPDPVPSSPRVVAHNLTDDEAEQLEAQLGRGLVEGHSIGVMPYVWEYEQPHAQTDPSNCLECEELVLRHCKHVLSLLEQERQRRAAK